MPLKPPAALASLLEGFEYPAILVSKDYEILATNKLYDAAFGEIESTGKHRCFEVSHGYSVPCDQAGESCPLKAAKASGHRERVLHIHQTPRGAEHVDVELIPLLSKNEGESSIDCFVELLKPIPLVGGAHTEREMVGSSPAFNRMLEEVSRVAGTEAAVLLRGESGTGKELVARAIHQGSLRQNQAMVTLECAGITDSLFESELFGHVKGAFTGALSNHSGLVEAANGGTLFLDEIGDVPASVQVKLLRLLETGTYRQVGNSEVKRADFRLVSATNRDLESMVASGDFRADLYYRLNVFPIYLPSLSERRSDIPLLSEWLLQRLAQSRAFSLSIAAIDRLQSHEFAGNIRELRNILQRAVVYSDTEEISLETINQCLLTKERHSGASSAKHNLSSSNKTEQLQQDLKSIEAKYINKVLDSLSGDKEQAAQVLGISTRSLYRKLAQSEARSRVS